MAPARKECSPSGIESNTGKTKIERLVPAWFVAVGIRQVTKCNPHRQFSPAAFEIELVPNHFAIRERLRMVRAGNRDRFSNCRSARHQKSPQQDRDSHAVNPTDDAGDSPAFDSI